MHLNIVLYIILAASLITSRCAGSTDETTEYIKNLRAADYFADKRQLLLATAIEAKDTASIQKLAEGGLDMNRAGKDGMRPLFWAIAKSKIESFEALLKFGANPNIKVTEIPGRERPVSVMEVVSISEDVRYIKLALKYHGDPNLSVDYGERTVLYEAVMSHRLANVQALIAAGASLNHQDEAGETPMMTASNVNDYQIVYILLMAGADPGIKDRWGNDLDAIMRMFGTRGINKDSIQIMWYQKVAQELKKRHP